MLDIKQLSLFFSLFTPKNSENRLLPAPVPPCPQPCLPPPCPRSRKFSSGLQLRAPSLVLPPFPPSLRFITRSPLFAYTFLVHTSAFPFVLFGSPISILLRPHPYCLVLPFSMLTVVFYSFPLLSLFFFPLSPCSSSPPITLQVHKIPLFSPCEIQKYPNFVTYHHFFHENLLAFQNLGIYFAPRNRNNEILSLLVSLVSLVLPFPLPPRQHRGRRGVRLVSLLYREDSCGAYKQEHSCYNHHHRLV